MVNIKKIIFLFDKITLKVGTNISWLVFFMTLIAFCVAFLRYFFNVGFVWMQELYIWMHGLVFLLGSSYALLDDRHVRVDIFYRNLSENYKAYINLIFSIIFIFPFIFIISKYSIPYIFKSWMSLEKSREAGGLNFLFLYKTSIIIFCFLMFIQTISIILRCLLVINKKEKIIFFKF